MHGVHCNPKHNYPLFSVLTSIDLEQVLTLFRTALLAATENNTGHKIHGNSKVIIP